MDKEPSFSESVAAELKHYVYRLVDPRDGNTFYVGRGQGNRVFDHSKGAAKLASGQDEMAEQTKLGIIRAIANDGFKVLYIIHRHGMDEATAKEVEAALIDVYPGATNRQSGFDSSKRGAMNVEKIIRNYEAPEAKFNHKLILINVNRSSGEFDDLYDSVRYAWKINPNKAEKYKLVLAVRRGMIIGAFEAKKWLPATPEHFPSFPPIDGVRYGFEGVPAPQNIEEKYVNKRVPGEFIKRGASNPIKYVELEKVLSRIK